MIRPIVGNVVKEFTLGNTRVKICDDFCRDRTPADVDAILKRIAARAIGPLQGGFGTRPYMEV